MILVPPKQLCSIVLCFESAGIMLSTSEGECVSHQGRALSLRTLDTHSARENKPQPSPHLLHFPFGEEIQEFNNNKNILRLDFTVRFKAGGGM